MKETLYSKLRLNKPLRSLRLSSFGLPDLSYFDFEKKIKKAKEDEAKALSAHLFKNLNNEFNLLTKEIGKRLPELVLKIVRKVIGGVELDKENVQNVVQEVLEKNAPEDENLKVYLSCVDYDKLIADENMLKNEYPKVEFIRDDSLSSGDCLVSSRFGLIDARVETKLNQIQQNLN